MECKGLNIKAFAELLDVPYHTLQNYLLNQCTPSAEVLIKISDVLNVDLNWLMCGKGTMFNSVANGNELSEKLAIIEYCLMIHKLHFTCRLNF